MANTTNNMVKVANTIPRCLSYFLKVLVFMISSPIQFAAYSVTHKVYEIIYIINHFFNGQVFLLLKNICIVLEKIRYHIDDEFLWQIISQFSILNRFFYHFP